MAEYGFAITYYRNPEERTERLGQVLEHFMFTAWEMDWPAGVEPELVDQPLDVGPPGAGVRGLGWYYNDGGNQ